MTAKNPVWGVAEKVVWLGERGSDFFFGVFYVICMDFLGFPLVVPIDFMVLVDVFFGFPMVFG